MRKTSSFGKRKQPHTIIIAQGDKVRHFEIRPWVAALALSVILAGSVGYLGATAYLIFRDDLINASLVRQARIQHAYEDRISALRAQVDRITSHRLLDKQFVETRIAELASRQDLLVQRSATINPLLERANGLKIGGAAGFSSGSLPVPQVRPGSSSEGSDTQASLDDVDPLVTASVDPLPEDESLTSLTGVRDELTAIEYNQVRQLRSLTVAAYEKRNAIIETARKAGLSLREQEMDAVGGPFVPADQVDGERFHLEAKELRAALDALDQTRAAIRTFPIANPAPGRSISSGFGNRRDPIIGKSAFHAGIDFRTPTGTPIRATASGKVVRAGRAGGYGKLVEIEHANGLRTRYAHLSKIHVRKGQRVEAGMTVGAAGSTGRSTGPHLHYEVRSGGKAVNPMTELKAGTRMRDYL
ncbi:MAG: M23 family metallopeptidase [Pseudomonadota bacterium]